MRSAGPTCGVQSHLDHDTTSQRMPPRMLLRPLPCVQAKSKSLRSEQLHEEGDAKWSASNSDHPCPLRVLCGVVVGRRCLVFGEPCSVRAVDVERPSKQAQASAQASARAKAQAKAQA